MAASTSGALKAFIESKGLNISVFRDQAPANTPLPYLSVTEAVAIVPDKLEDGVATTVKEHATVTVWMQWKNLTTGQLTESYTLPAAVLRTLQGSRLLTSGSGAPATTTYGVLIRNAGPRLVEQDDNVVSFPIWVEIWRNA